MQKYIELKYIIVISTIYVRFVDMYVRTCVRMYVCTSVRVYVCTYVPLHVCNSLYTTYYTFITGVPALRAAPSSSRGSVRPTRRRPGGGPR